MPKIKDGAVAGCKKSSAALLPLISN